MGYVCPLIFHERKQAQEWQGLRCPSDPGILGAPSHRRVSKSLSGPGIEGHPRGKVSSLTVQSWGNSQPPSPLPSLVVQGFAWAAAWIGRGGVIKGSEPDRKPSLSCQPLQPPPQPPPGLRWARNRTQGLGEGRATQRGWAGWWLPECLFKAGTASCILAAPSVWGCGTGALRGWGQR